jgi:hypothetical protein
VNCCVEENWESIQSLAIYLCTVVVVHTILDAGILYTELIFRVWERVVYGSHLQLVFISDFMQR